MILQADARQIPLRDGCVQCCVSSPPYWGLRDYGVSGQIGLEATPDEYVATMVGVFREVWRVLRDDGTVWLNLGSSYFGGGGFCPTAPSTATSKSGKYGSTGALIKGRSLEALRGRAYDISDKERSDSHPSDSTSSRLCDACRETLSATNNARTGHSPEQAQEPLSCESIHEHRESALGHSPTSDSILPADRNGAANQGRATSLDLAGGPLLASDVSTLLESSSPRRAGCHHCANCGACLSVLGSSSRDARLCARRWDDTSCNEFRDATSRRRMTDRMLASEAWIYLTTQCLKSKDDCAIPWLVALALRADGWYLRSDIIWAKPTPMPESVTDRPTRSHEYIFLLSKSERYFYDVDAIREPAIAPHTAGTNSRVYQDRDPNHPSERKKGMRRSDLEGYGLTRGTSNPSCSHPNGRNKRSVWTVNSEAVSEAHFATFPQKLIEPCILAGSRSGDLVLDPFLGSGTTGKVCERLGRKWVGLELSADYIGIGLKRTAQLGLRI